MKQLKDKAYLVYRSVNGKITAEIQYGEHTTGEGKQKDTEEIDRYLIDCALSLPINKMKEMYPCRVSKQEK